MGEVRGRGDRGACTVDVTALKQSVPSVSLLVSSNTIVSDVLTRILQKFKLPDVTIDDLVIVEDEVRGSHPVRGITAESVGTPC